MVSIGSIGSIWYQLASICFLLTCVARNFLQIRILIIIGNLLLVINASLGWPFWPEYVRDPIVLAPDSIVWGGLIALFNFISVLFEIKKSKQSFYRVILLRKFLG